MLTTSMHPSAGSRHIFWLNACQILILRSMWWLRHECSHNFSDVTQWQLFIKTEWYWVIARCSHKYTWTCSKIYQSAYMLQYCKKLTTITLQTGVVHYAFMLTKHGAWMLPLWIPSALLMFSSRLLGAEHFISCMTFHSCIVSAAVYIPLMLTLRQPWINWVLSLTDYRQHTRRGLLL